MFLSLTTIFAAVLLGSMVFFSFVATPAIHRNLAEDAALAFNRKLFPRYYLWGLTVSVIAALAMLARSYTSILLLVVLTGFAYSRQVLLPQVVAAKDRWLASDTPQDKALYRVLHQRSMLINITQMVLLALVCATTQLLHIRVAQFFE